MKTISHQQALRYNRQIVLNGFDLDKQEALINKTALIVGLGGLGCAVAQYLAAAGVGKLTLIDFDKVDLSNLQRQILHTEARLDSPKVESAKQALSEINSEIEIEALHQEATQPVLNQLIPEQDIVLDCCDNLVTRNTINQVCWQHQVDMVSGAAIRMEGQIFCMQPKKQTACYQCLSQYFAAPELSCVESGVMSPLVGIIGATQALEAIKVLTDFGQLATNTLQMYDASISKWRSFSVPKNLSCNTCSS
ncbi:molybdopterin-synthase adenylyltransferase MoeB [Glaciecola sp. 1036]|uniref:molybdopterin-synthase adenylyltransferase MoeB n=1 Tax=Alteromonadaceae TaxID=72275 RepID=UPI003CFDDB43